MSDCASNNGQLTPFTVHYLFFVTTIISEVVGTVGGFGSSVFFVPLAGLFFNIHTVPTLICNRHVFST